MRFNPRIWRPVAIGLGIINTAGAGFALALEQGEHAGVHLLLAAASGFWASRMNRNVGAGRKLEPGEQDARLEALEVELDEQRRELAEAQERLDFAERMLAQAVERRQVEPGRVNPVETRT